MCKEAENGTTSQYIYKVATKLQILFLSSSWKATNVVMRDSLHESAQLVLT